MKKKFMLLTPIVTFGLFASVVSASKCDYSELTELNREASGVKVSYEQKKDLVTDPDVLGESDVGVQYDVYDNYFRVNITNVTDNLYVKIINNADNSTKLLSSSDSVDGVISFDYHDQTKITNLTVKIYTSSKTSCPDEEILVNYLTLPKYNEYSTWKACENNKDESICKEYVTQDVTKDMYDKLAAKEEKAAVKKFNEENNGNAVTRFVKKNKKGFIIGGSIIIVMGVVTTAVVIKRRRSRLI